MKAPSLLITSLIAFAPMAAYAAPPDHSPPRSPMAPHGHEAGPRTVGYHVVPHPGQPVHKTKNPPHQVYFHNEKTGHDEHHPVIVDWRPGHVVDRDPHIRIGVRVGYRPAHEWAVFHMPVGGWWRMWGVGNWDEVGTVTCEAANEETGELYPVSVDRDANGWDDPSVNLILDQAMDDCMAEAGRGACVPATPSCSFQRY